MREALSRLRSTQTCPECHGARLRREARHVFIAEGGQRRAIQQLTHMTLADAQAWFARDVIMERLDLPGRADMVADSKVWVARDQALENASQEIDFQTDYVRDLMTYTDYPPFDLDKVAALFKEWKHDKQADILGYRDKSYRSTMTGTVAPPHHTPWMQAMDDSLEAFLADGAPATDLPSAAPHIAQHTAAVQPLPLHGIHPRRKQAA